jgi:hypothetical protein
MAMAKSQSEFKEPVFSSLFLAGALGHKDHFPIKKRPGTVTDQSCYRVISAAYFQLCNYHVRSVISRVHSKSAENTLFRNFLYEAGHTFTHKPP